MEASSNLVIPVANALYADAVNGNDTSGTRGRQDRPYLTLSAACAAASSGDTIWVYGAHSIPSVVTHPSGVTIRLVSAVLQAGSSNTTGILVGAAASTGCKLIDAELDGNGKNITLALYDSSTNLEVRGCYFHGSGRKSLNLSTSATRANILWNRVEGTTNTIPGGQPAIFITGGDQCRVIGNHASNSTSYCIDLNACTNCVVQGNTVRCDVAGSLTAGIGIVGGSNNEVAGNTCLNTVGVAGVSSGSIGGAPGISLSGSPSGCTVVGNVCSGWNTGIAITGNSHTVSGNSANGNFDNGIQVLGPSFGCTVVGNSVIDNYWTGIICEGPDSSNYASDVLIQGNTTSGNGWGINVAGRGTDYNGTANIKVGTTSGGGYIYAKNITIKNNIVRPVSGVLNSVAPHYGIFIAQSVNTGCTVASNDMALGGGAYATQALLDLGTGTVFTDTTDATSGALMAQVFG